MLTMKDIIKEGHPTLAKRAKEVALPLSEEDIKTLELMMEFLINSQDDDIADELDLRAGVGLAAPQINISKRFMAILAWDERNEFEHKYLLVNPKITRNSITRTYISGGEGCLSVDREVEGLVPRYKKITVVAHNYNLETNELEPVELKFNGYIGVVFQHELDHLNGILFVDKLEENLDGVMPIEFIDLVIENLDEK